MNNLVFKCFIAIDMKYINLKNMNRNLNDVE